jgi:membrane-associated phospholipid phosphatase
VTLVTLWLARRSTPRLFWALLPIGTGLIVSTVALRYHYAVDVIAGALLVPPSLWLARSIVGGAGEAGAGPGPTPP